MDLQQEYYTRHAITAPLVVFPDNNGNHSLVLKNLGYKKARMPRWMVLLISYHKQENHPPYYKFVQYVPQHDSCGHSNNPLKQLWEKKVYWDEWEPFILEWTENNKGELVGVHGDELNLALWEMFQYSHDSWLAQNLHDRQKDSLFVAVDDTVENAARIAAYKEVEDFIRAKNKKVAAALSSLRGYGEGKKFYASWLAKLL
jgi:hypothetical protein